MRCFRFLAFVSASLLAGSGVSGPYTDLIVFGDSLSDIGNVSAATLGLQPGSGYFNGRFSNGPVYAERLAEGLGLDSLSRSGAGGGDYAFGGAETNGPGGFTGLFIDSLVEQVDEYLGDVAGSGADPLALHVVLIGGNDLINGQTNAAAPVGVVQTQIQRLITAGARQVLGINLPPLGLTPDQNSDPIGAAQISALTEEFNTGLANAYDSLESSNPAVTIHRVDLAQQITDLVENPAQWGFTNVTGRGQDVAAGGLEAPGFLFWDGLHPTREGHALLGEAAIRAVLPQGDFDRDGQVTTADLQVWSGGYGAVFDASLGLTDNLAADANGDGRVDAADYTLWRDAFIAVASIPEPVSIGLIALGILAVPRRTK